MLSLSHKALIDHRWQQCEEEFLQPEMEVLTSIEGVYTEGSTLYIILLANAGSSSD